MKYQIIYDPDFNSVTIKPPRLMHAYSVKAHTRIYFLGFAMARLQSHSTSTVTSSQPANPSFSISMVKADSKVGVVEGD